MFKTVKRIIDWCGEFKGKLYLGFIFFVLFLLVRGNAGHGGSVHHWNALRCRARRRDI